MFFSRPDIKPLGWDLQALPEGMDRHWTATTTEGMPIVFRLGGGHIEVKTAPIGTSFDDYSAFETILSKHIAPSSWIEVIPEQICDILGLTVGKQVVVADEGKVKSLHLYDWSGKTTYWLRYANFSEASTYELLRRAKAIAKDFYAEEMDCAQSPPIMPAATQNSDVDEFNNFLQTIKMKNNMGEHIKIGTCGITARRSPIPTPMTIGFKDVELSPSFALSFHGEFSSSELKTFAYIERIESLLVEMCFTDLEMIDLTTNSSMGFCEAYFSNDLKNWCFEKPRRFLAAGSSGVGALGPSVWYGLRPKLAK